MRKGFEWGRCVRRMPQSWGADKQRGNEWKKLQKLSFLKLEIMLEMDIFRQTK